MHQILGLSPWLRETCMGADPLLIVNFHTKGEYEQGGPVPMHVSG